MPPLHLGHKKPVPTPPPKSGPVPTEADAVTVAPGVKAWGSFAPKDTPELPPGAEALPPEKQQEVLEVMRSLSEVPPAARAAEPVALVPPPEPPVSALAPPPKADCPHCGWDQTKTDIEVSEEDKAGFVKAVLTRGRFLKDYPLLGGAVRVTFRSLTTAEADLALTQTTYDAESPQIHDLPQMVRVLTDYRMCLALARLETGTERQTLPEWLDPEAVSFDPLPPRNTVLKLITPRIYDEVLRSEPLRVAVGQAFYDFQRLVERMEWKAADPNFWKVAGSP